MARYCENTDGEAWSLSHGRGVTYLVHEADLTSADKERAQDVAGPFLFFNSQQHGKAGAGFDFKNAQGPPALEFAEQKSE